MWSGNRGEEGPEAQGWETDRWGCEAGGQEPWESAGPGRKEVRGKELVWLDDGRMWLGAPGFWSHGFIKLDAHHPNCGLPGGILYNSN